jgi:hypothetical protein
MQLGGSSRRDASEAAVWPDLAVVLPPVCRGAAGLLQRFEPLLVQVFISELAVEALDVAVLRGPAWLDQDVADAVGVGPCHEGLLVNSGPLSVRTASG